MFVLFPSFAGTAQFFKSPIKIEIAASGSPLDTIKQLAYPIPNFYTKVNFLVDLLRDKETYNKVLVFVKNKKQANILYEELEILLPGETALFLNVDVTARDGRKYSAMPGIAIDNSSIRQISDTVVAQSLVLQFNKVIDQDKGVLQIGVKESGSITDLITLKVYEFPMINILWLGVIVMVVGFVMSIIQRYKALKNNLKVS